MEHHIVLVEFPKIEHHIVLIECPKIEHHIVLIEFPKVNAPHRGPKDRAPHSPDKNNTAPVRRTKWNQQKLSPTNATEYGIRIP